MLEGPGPFTNRSMTATATLFCAHTRSIALSASTCTPHAAPVLQAVAVAISCTSGGRRGNLVYFTVVIVVISCTSGSCRAVLHAALILQAVVVVHHAVPVHHVVFVVHHEGPARQLSDCTSCISQAHGSPSPSYNSCI